MNFDEWAETNWMYIDLKGDARTIWESAQNEEREACAKVCDGLAERDYCVDVRMAAAAIRKRYNVK